MWNDLSTLLIKELGPRNEHLEAVQALAKLEQGALTLREVARQAKRLSQIAFRGGEELA